MTAVEAVLTGQDNSKNIFQPSRIMGRDDFLKLLIVQLRYQDPLSPMNNEEFVAQLAQFSSLEQLRNMNANLADNLKANSSLAQMFNNTMAATLIGKNVTALGNGIHLGGSGSVAINYELSNDAANMAVRIFDSNGKLVRTINRTSLPSGSGLVEWDGKSQLGSRVPAGDYSFSISATDGEGEAVDSRGIVLGRVSGVSYRDGNAFLLVGDEGVPLSQIIRIEE